MSVYLDMWQKVKELTPEQLEYWIERTTPSRGRGIDFYGMMLVDNDLHEAVEYMRNELNQQGGQNGCRSSKTS